MHYNRRSGSLAGCWDAEPPREGWRRSALGVRNGPASKSNPYDDTPLNSFFYSCHTAVPLLMPSPDAFRPRLPIDPFAAAAESRSPWHVPQDLPHSPPQVILILGGAQSPRPRVDYEPANHFHQSPRKMNSSPSSHRPTYPGRFS